MWTYYLAIVNYFVSVVAPADLSRGVEPSGAWGKCGVLLSVTERLVACSRKHLYSARHKSCQA
jgi:hypothetical protein